MTDGDAPGSGIRVRVLGPLVLFVDGTPVAVPGAKRQAVLAMLVMGAPDPVSVDRIVDAVWPDDPPSSGRAALQSHVSRIRRHLHPHESRLTSTGGGYRLSLDRADVDAFVLADRVREAAAARERDPVAAQRLLDDARARPWRGPPLDGLLDVAPLAGWSRSLADAWADAGDVLAACALSAGDITTAVSVSAEICVVEPLRESSAVLRVRALAASGRGVEALREANAFRRRLAEETGLEPSPALGAAEQEAVGGETAPRTSLASPLTPLLGRDAELAGIARLLASERLVTLVGPGGVGKTHLALEVAHRASVHVAVTLVRLSPVSEGAAVIEALAEQLGIDAGATGDLVERCVRILRQEARLVVLDTCEHLLDAVRTLVAELLGKCPQLVLLATSRERLALPAEQTCRLDPLAVAGTDGLAHVASSPAVALFLDRAGRAAGPARLEDVDLASVARIVRALDGLPLAIELAAGRLASMGVPDLEARLDRALDLLGRPRFATTRSAGHHDTLRAAIQWSYDLLPPDEQRLFRHLAIFPDGVDLDTAERLAEDLDVGADPGAALAHLVDASMVVSQTGPAPRYTMLDTIRGFGLDALRASGETDAAETRLVDWAIALATWFLETSQSEEEPVADVRLRGEIANLRGAWRVAMGRRDVSGAAAIVVGLQMAVSWRERIDVRAWAIELADAPELAGNPLEAPAVALGAEATWFGTGDLRAAERLAVRAMATLESRIDLDWAMVHHVAADLHLLSGRSSQAAALHRLAAKYEPWAHDGHTFAALGLAYDGDLPGARAELEIARQYSSYPTVRAFARYVEGEIAGLEMDWDTAEVAYREAIATAQTTGATFIEGVAEVGLVSALAATGRMRDALCGYEALIDRWERAGSWVQQWTTLRNLGDVLDSTGERVAAELLRAAADRAPGPDAPEERDEAISVARAAVAMALDDASPAARPESGMTTCSGRRSLTERRGEATGGSDDNTT